MLRYKTLIALTIAVAGPALAETRSDHVEVDGQKLDYTTELRDNGEIHFAGVIRETGEPFVLDVKKDGHVAGYFGSAAVEYDVARKLRDKVAADLGEGPTVAQANLGK
jgi:hypothetical protein